MNSFTEQLKYFLEKENVKQMIMSVMGIEEERKINHDPRTLRQQSLQSQSLYQKSLQDESLVQKLMEGSMVITASEDHKDSTKDKEFKNISGFCMFYSQTSQQIIKQLKS